MPQTLNLTWTVLSSKLTKQSGTDIINILTTDIATSPNTLDSDQDILGQ